MTPVAMTQLQLFSEESALEIAQRAIGRFRNESLETQRFTRAILSRLRAAGPRGLVFAGCSPAVDQHSIVEDVLRTAAGVPADSPPPSEGIVRVVAPPDTLGLAPQLATLHDRYRTHRMRTSAVVLANRPLVVHATTEAEALAELLREVRASLVCIEHAENLVPSSTSGAKARAICHLADIATRSGVPHLLIGVREVMLTAAHSAGLPLPPPTVVQRLYDPASESDTSEFAGILKFCDEQLKGCRDMSLVSFTRQIMKFVGGDPCRLTSWVSLAACEAMRRQSSHIGWEDLKVAAGRVVASAESDWTTYRAFTQSPALPFGP